MDSTIKIVRAFIQQNFFVPGPLRDDESLLDGGIIDSTGVLELVGFVESEFGVQVLDEEILPENLDSIGQITAYVSRKREALPEALVRKPA